MTLRALVEDPSTRGFHGANPSGRGEATTGIEPV
jgi:hypothetical protein